MKYELVIYAGGTAVLADEEGETLWASDADDEFAAEFDAVTYEDGDAIAEYLEDNDYLPDGVRLDIVESDDTGMHEILSGDLEDDEDEDEDEDEDAEFDA